VLTFIGKALSISEVLLVLSGIKLQNIQAMLYCQQFLQAFSKGEASGNPSI
jgi:hypothetical protein